MTQAARHIAFAPQQVQRTLGTDVSLVDVFHGDQQEYVRLPTGRLTPIASMPREFLPDVESLTFNTTSAAWISHGIEPVVPRGTPDSYAGSLPPTSLVPILVTKPISSAGAWAKHLTGLEANVYWSLASAPLGKYFLKGMEKSVPNYEGVFVLCGGTMSTQDLIFPAEETAVKLICDAVPSLPISDTGDLARRLLELERDLQDEENPACPGISVESLKKFFAFVRANPDIKLPAISISPDCNVYASWKADSARVFSIHFIPEADVRFVLFRPSQKQRGKMIRLSGSAMLEEVIDIARREGATDWIRR